jgi:orotate phosphoribosyltransferase
MYIDWRKALGKMAFRNLLLTFLQNAAPEFIYKVCDTGALRDVVFAGVATGAIPIPAMLADRLCVPFCYVRADEKVHGLSAKVVGADVSGRKVILFEDVVTMATSSAPAVAALKVAGGDVRACISFFDYEFPEAAKAFESFGVLHRSLCCFTDVKRYLERDRLALASTLAEWHADPWGWTEMMEGKFPELAHR